MLQQVSYLERVKELSLWTRRAQLTPEHYVVNRAALSMEAAKIESIAEELHGAFSKYGFAIKYILKTYETNNGITTSEKTEGYFGLRWDFVSDEPGCICKPLC